MSPNVNPKLGLNASCHIRLVSVTCMHWVLLCAVAWLPFGKIFFGCRPTVNKSQITTQKLSQELLICRGFQNYFNCFVGGIHWVDGNSDLFRMSVQRSKDGPHELFILQCIVPLYMKGCICHFTKLQIHPFLSKGRIYIRSQVGQWVDNQYSPKLLFFLQKRSCIYGLLSLANTGCSPITG